MSHGVASSRRTAPAAPEVDLTILGPDELWYFDSAAPANYLVTAQYSCNRAGGTYLWQTSGELTLSSATAASPLATAAAPSTAGGASITLTYTPSSGPPEQATKSLTVRAPTTLLHLYDADTADATWGYDSRIYYSIVDQFNTVLPQNVPINEQWSGAVVSDYPSMNWRRGVTGSALVAPNNWSDQIQGETASARVPLPVAPGQAGASTAVYHWPGEWRVGSLTIGTGRRVTCAAWQNPATVVWQKFRGYGRHV